MSVRRKVGDLLKERRKELGQTQAQCAAALGISEFTLCKYERSVLLPQDEMLWTLAKAFGLEYEKLKVMKQAQRAPRGVK